MNHVNGHTNHVPMTILVYGQQPLSVPWNHIVTAEIICGRAAQHLQISCLSSHLFALYDEEREYWLQPATGITRNMKRLRYRMRFHTSTNVNTLEPSVVKYMFEQYKALYLEDQLFENIELTEALGLLVLDIAREAKEENVSVSRVCRRVNFTKALPASVENSLSFWEKRNLRRKVKKHLKTLTFDAREDLTYKIMYMISLIEEYKEFGSEFFETIHGEVFVVSAARGIEKKVGIDVSAESHDSNSVPFRHQYLHLLSSLAYLTSTNALPFINLAHKETWYFKNKMYTSLCEFLY